MSVKAKDVYRRFSSRIETTATRDGFVRRGRGPFLYERSVLRGREVLVASVSSQAWDPYAGSRFVP
ncbi:MAG: hypothetical protein ACLGHP_08930, partial [Vicinamibacteria bacterium]